MIHILLWAIAAAWMIVALALAYALVRLTNLLAERDRERDVHSQRDGLL